MVSVDCSHPQEVLNVVSDYRPAVVINAVGERRPEFWDEASLVEANVLTAELAAIAATTSRAWLIHVSSDYVFNSSDVSRRPDAATSPLNCYGVSKLSAERAVRKISDTATILRMPVLFGGEIEASESTFASLALRLRQLKADQPIVADTWAKRYWTSSRDIAAAVAAMVSIEADLAGTIQHVSGDTCLSKFELAVTLARASGVPPEVVQAVDDAADDRAQHIRLDDSWLRSLTGWGPTPLSVAIESELRQPRWWT
jgi:dTDP-4-dehydrorhamnose reductase